MLLQLENITTFECVTDAVETAILTVRYDIAMTVFWCGIHRLPTDVELEKIMSSCILALNTGRLILHFEHVGDPALEVPSLDMIKNIVGTLLRTKDLLRKNLIGSIFETQVLDDKTKIMRDLFLSIYKPIKPLCLTDSKENIENFAKELSAQETEICHTTSSSSQ